MKNVVQDLTSAGLLGVWGKWMKHAKYIYNIQDFNPEQVLAVGYTKSKLVTDAMMWFDKFSCKRSDLVITVGRDLVETVENRFRGKKVPKTVMINNWIDENEIYPLDENNERVVAFKKKYGLDGKFVIMYTDSSRIEIVALIRKIAILLYRKPAKPLVTNAAMRNKAGLLFVYWKVLDGRPRKLQKIPPAAELQTVRNYSLFRKPSRTLFHFSGYS